MHYFILTSLLFYTFVYLFCVFVFSKDNFVLLRKNITTEQIFNISLLMLFMSILAARIFFVAFHFKHDYFNPLVFLLFSYFTGLSTSGGIVGAAGFLFLYSRRYKLPYLHLLDIFSLSLLPAVSVGIVFDIIFSKGTPFLGILVILNFIAFGLLSLFFQKAKFSDGGIGYFSLIAVSLILFLVQVFLGTITKPENILLILIFIIPLFLVVKQEGLVPKAKKLFGK